jgi:hypothetical protein
MSPLIPMVAEQTVHGERATCADPPRGKKKSAERTRPCTGARPSRPGSVSAPNCLPSARSDYRPPVARGAAGPLCRSRTVSRVDNERLPRGEPEAATACVLALDA